MAKNPYKVLTRPRTKQADIIRATLPGAYDDYHIHATCASREMATAMCRLLNLGLETDQKMEQVAPKTKAALKKIALAALKRPRKSRAR